jgi:glycerate kinase
VAQVLIAPDCLGDSFTAVEAAEAIARGWRHGRPGDELTLAPQSDGGPGFVGVLAGRLGEVHAVRVLVLAGQVTLDEATLADAGIAAAFSVAGHAGSVQLVISDAANQLRARPR